MTECSGLFLAGPPLVQASIRAKRPQRKTWAVQKCMRKLAAPLPSANPTTMPCIGRIRRGSTRWARPPPRRSAHRCAANRYQKEELRIFPRSRQANTTCSNSSPRGRAGDREYRAEYTARRSSAATLASAVAVGHVANQKEARADPRLGSDQKRIEFGGLIYTRVPPQKQRALFSIATEKDSADFLHDVNGFMVGKDAEWSGIIRAGKIVTQLSNSVVPKIP